MDATLSMPTRNGKISRPGVNLPALIGENLKRVEQVFDEVLTPYRSRFPVLCDQLAGYQGKRLRPTLMLLVGSALGKVNRAHHLLSAAIEMIHTATLVHDDVLDEAELRRHTATIHSRFGNKVSILLGDLLFTAAFHLSSRVGDAKSCEWIGDATNRVCAGELQQTLEGGNLNLTEAEYFQIVEGKTAALTECAARLGAIHAGSTVEQSDSLACYGRSLGIAFQIADDLLDITGDVKQVGKTLGTDLDQKKLTLPMIYLFERLPESESRSLKESLHRNDDSVRDQLLSRLESTHAIRDARRTAVSYISQAQRGLQVLPRSDYRDALENIAEWSLLRNR